MNSFASPKKLLYLLPRPGSGRPSSPPVPGPSLWRPRRCCGHRPCRGSSCLPFHRAGGAVLLPAPVHVLSVAPGPVPCEESLFPGGTGRGVLLPVEQSRRGRDRGGARQGGDGCVGTMPAAKVPDEPSRPVSLSAPSVAEGAGIVSTSSSRGLEGLLAVRPHIGVADARPDDDPASCCP